MKVDLDVRGLDPLTEILMNLPGDFARARKSAISSLGWWVRGHLRNHIEYGGTASPKLHPMTQRFWSKRKPGMKKKAWFGRRRAYNHNNPFEFLAKFSRYRIDAEGNAVQIDFGKSKRGRPGTLDPELASIAKRAEYGETIRVTKAMRRFFGTQRKARKKKQVPGVDFFPLKKTTKTLKTEKRPIFGPVFRKIRGKIPKYFQTKFFGALDRYWKGTKKK